MEDPVHYVHKKVRITMPTFSDEIMEHPGEGWKMTTELTRELHRSQSVMDRTLTRNADKLESRRGFMRNRYGQRHWVTYYRMKKGEWSDLFKAEHPGKGWKSAKEIAKEIGRHVAIVERIVARASEDGEVDLQRGFTLDHNDIKHFTTFYRIKDRKRTWMDFYMAKPLGKEWITISQLWDLNDTYSRSCLSQRMNEAVRKGEVETKHNFILDRDNNKHFSIYYRLIGGGSWKNFLKLDITKATEGWRRSENLIKELGYPLSTLHRKMNPFIESGHIEVKTGLFITARHRRVSTTFYRAKKGFRWDRL